MLRRIFKRGDSVIFRKVKHSTCPGPRARDIHPAPRGDDYTYRVDKFWVVADSLENGKVVVKTRRGKRHLIDPDNANLRRAQWWERLVYWSRFPRAEETDASSASSTGLAE